MTPTSLLMSNPWRSKPKGLPVHAKTRSLPHRRGGSVNVVWILSLCIIFQVCSLLLIAQQSQPERATGDTQALSTVTEALTVLSGTSSWNGIHAAHLTGTISTPSKNGLVVSPIEWKDIWQQRKIWYLHTIGTGNSKRDLIQNAGSGRMSRRADKSVMPVGRGAQLPPVELPGATLSIAMQDSHCDFRSLPLPKDNQSEQVELHCHFPDLNEEQQVWQFSRSTHLP